MHRKQLMIALATVAAIAGSAHAQTTYYVDASCGNNAWTGTSATCAAPDGPKATLQAAIGGASAGDEIVVQPGTYAERINLLGKALTLRSSNGPAVTTINGGAAGSVITCATGEGPNTIIRGFTVTNGSATAGGGMRNNGASPTVVNCIFRANNATYGAGMLNEYSSHPLLLNCIFSGNTATWGGGGLYNERSSPTLANCAFTGNTASANGGGMSSAAYPCEPTVTNCVFWGNTCPNWPNVSDGPGSVTTMTYSCIPEGWSGVGNIVADPRFADADGPDGIFGTADDDLRLLAGSPCIDAGSNSAAGLAGISSDIVGHPRLMNDPNTPDTGSGTPPVVDLGPYEFWPDCNGNGIPDATDIANCDPNDLACQDCNANGVPDACDLAAGTSLDCNANGIPDECDIAAGTSPDCNANGVPDACDIAAGTSQDCNANGIPDECDIAAGTSADCNANSVPDECDLATGASLDCNANGVPDECDIAAGTSRDCNANGVPDECEPGGTADCNNNGVTDWCDLAAGTSLDCNGNRIPDECDIATGTSADANTNGIPDECEQIHNVTQGTFHAKIQLAIDAAVAGDEVVVQPGTYVERIDLRGKAITLRSSAGPAVTTIDGAAGGTVITCASGEGPDTVIEGFTVTNGTGSGTGGDKRGGGMRNIGSSPTVNGCIFSGNTARRGGGMYNKASYPALSGCVFAGNWTGSATGAGGGMLNEAAGPTLTNCTFSQNTVGDSGFGGGIFSFDNSSLTLTDCTFTGNSVGRNGFGGALCAYDTDTIAVRCTFASNSAVSYGNGGAWHSDNGSARLTHCTFRGNATGAASYGGAMSTNNAVLTLASCTFTGNTADYCGGALYIHGYSTASVVQCTFSANSATYVGGAIHCGQDHVALGNSVLWGNTAALSPQIHYTAGGPLTATYCCIQGGWPGTGNIATDPLFVDADGADDVVGTPDDDVHLQQGSPCINAGNNAAVPVDLTTDFEGDARIQHCRVDMGVDETPYFRDCNSNGVADACDLSQGPSADCNGNGIPDECELGGTQDCNTNGVSDLCDIYSGTSADCNANGIPDECDVAALDCNGNGVPDDCDIAAGTSLDCNTNGVPDECDVTLLDCNANGVPDDCDIASCDGSPACSDCNHNGVPDGCDITAGTSPDTNPADGIPDECQGVQPITGACCLNCACIVATEAACVAAGGTYQGDGVTCTAANCTLTGVADLDGDGDVDLDDFALFQQQFVGPLP